MKKLIFTAGMFFGLIFGQQNGARYLIVTHDNYYNDILPLAQWKHKKGYYTKVVKLSETGSTSAQIRNEAGTNYVELSASALTLKFGNQSIVIDDTEVKINP